jgi:peptide/nickel transport system permease protein
MLAFLLRRLLLTMPVLLGVATLVFALLHLVPGDPAVMMLGEGAAPDEVSTLRERLGLNRPLHEQYQSFLGGLLRADLGESFRLRRPVAEAIAQRVSATAELAVAAVLVAVVLALPLGMLAAVWKGQLIDTVSIGFALIGISIPNFWLGPLLAIVFAVELGWLPVSGRGSLAHLVLPSLTLGAALAAILARMTRASLLDELHQAYVVTARAKGASRARAVVRHAFRNSLIPIVTIMALQLGSVLTGTIITETVFSWPGIGRLLIDAINARDYPLVQGCVLFIAVTYVAANLAADLLYGVLDPRIRYD